MSETLRERFMQALLDRGYAMHATYPYATGRYSVLGRRKGGYYFLGRSGALRYGPAVTRSRPVSDAFKAKLLNSSMDQVQP